MKFQNPPLVEIIAEIRWPVGLPDAAGNHPGNPVPVFGSAYEMLFMSFAQKVAPDGFTALERLLPPDFPALAGQPAFRYRKAFEGATLVYQLGPGIFTVNTTPPYQSWAEFFPVVSRGIEYLLACFAESGQKHTINSLQLRYIDAFKDDLVKGRSPLEFLKTALKVEILTPEVFDQLRSNQGYSGVRLQLGFPIQTPANARLNFDFHTGRTRGARALVLNTAVTIAGPIASEAAEIGKALNDSHDVIHRLFVDLSESMHQDMKPV